VIFGASGDLTARKLLPALANLAKENLLAKQFVVIGVATREWDTRQFQQAAREAINKYADGGIQPQTVDWLIERLDFVSGNFEDAATYERLKTKIESVSNQHQVGDNILYYLATAPRFFAVIPQQLHDVGLVRETSQCWRRVVVEKPFGSDLESAIELNRQLRHVLDEQQIYRIDHYLGKETVKNILVFRFANGIYEPIWNRRYVDHVQITAAETVGVEGRGSYYEHAGALRDMVPNHLFQLLSLTTMEPPNSFEADAVHNRQVDILKAITPVDPNQQAVRGQYDAGTCDAHECIAYRAEERVANDSMTPTCVAMKLMIDNWRWAGVPFYLRTGKRLARRMTQIAIRFKKAPLMLFRDTAIEQVADNWLVIEITPREAISLSFGAKVPGAGMSLGNVEMEFCYKDYFGDKPQTGYERLLYDCMIGDRTLFQRSDMVETSWGVVQPILEAWQSTPATDFPNYPAGSWGPDSAERLLRDDARHWRNCP
jgi:glucose-6-phosphate 1-dehydrogenase